MEGYKVYLECRNEFSVFFYFVLTCEIPPPHKFCPRSIFAHVGRGDVASPFVAKRSRAMARILPPLVAVLLFLSLSSLSDGLIHHISVSDDTRSVFRLETFGFFEGGLISLSVTGFKVP